MPLLTFPLTFNQCVGWPIKQTPSFNTIIQTPASGRGVIRITEQGFPLWDFVIDLSYISGDNEGTNTNWQTLMNFYMAVQGAGNDWLFLHPYDSTAGSYTVTGTFTSGAFVTRTVRENVIQSSTGATAQLITTSPGQLTISPWNPTGTPDGTHTWVGQTSGAVFTPSGVPVLSSSMAINTGDGTTVGFSMIRTLVSGGAQDLVQNFVYAPDIYVNGSLKTGYYNSVTPPAVWNNSQYYTTGQYVISGSSVYSCVLSNINQQPPNATYWTVQSSYAYIIDKYGTLTFTSAPPNGQSIAWTGQFYYRCYFLEDKWDSLQEAYYQIWEAEGIKFRSVLL